MFGERSPVALAYAEILGRAGVDRGLIGPRERPRLWRRHILNCAAVAPLFGPSSTLCDVGSGAGLPGIVVALSRPDLTVTLLEPMLRRARFLDEVVAQLELVNVTVVRGRAEEQVAMLAVDAATARAVAPLETLARWCLPLVRRGGEVVALKGSTAEREVEQAAGVLRRLGVVDISIETHGGGFVNPPTTVVRLRSGSSDVA